MVLNQAAASPQSGIANYDLAFQISPIILQGGIAGNQGAQLPILQLLGVTDLSKPDAFPRFLPLPGSTLISQSVGMYPFANQAVAANATIQQPLTISLIMLAPVNQPGGYLAKSHTFNALQASLSKHNAEGGTYNVATPAFLYTNMLMTAITDASPEDERQVQIHWQFDFIQPLITKTAAAAAQSNLFQKVTAGQQINGTPSWSGNQQANPAILTGIVGALNAFGEALP